MEKTDTKIVRYTILLRGVLELAALLRGGDTWAGVFTGNFDCQHREKAPSSRDGEHREIQSECEVRVCVRYGRDSRGHRRPKTPRRAFESELLNFALSNLEERHGCSKKRG